MLFPASSTRAMRHSSLSFYFIICVIYRLAVCSRLENLGLLGSSLSLKKNKSRHKRCATPRSPFILLFCHLCYF
ncbi:hypothetical protein T492DRAFT_1008426 [Pavlovales sp. CCMP2436]|nr:hypothetical protein T492DRAFT_1008426 [Pavlovales sp. CCMP2436]